MAEITQVRFSFIARDGMASPRIAARVHLNNANEFPPSRRGGCLALTCWIEEWDRRGLSPMIRAPLHIFQEIRVQGEDFEGGVDHDVIFREAFPLRDLREDLIGRSEVAVTVFMVDLTGRRRRPIDSRRTGPFRLPRLR